MSISVTSEFLYDILRYQVIPSLAMCDILHFSSTCKVWHHIISGNDFWQNVSIEKGFPLVDGKERNRKADFQILYKTAGVSRRAIGYYWGEMMGRIPFIDKELIEWLREEDVWDKLAPGPGKKRLNQDTFRWDVIPSHVRRIVNRQSPLALDLDGETLIVVDPNQVVEQELVIPLSLKNLRTLSTYPLNGKKNLPLFNKHCVPQAFNQSETIVHEVQIWFSRKEDVSRDMEWEDQESSVENKGEKYVVMGLFPLAWRECHHILEFGIPLLHHSYARTSTLGHFLHGNYPLCLGNPKQGVGLSICLSYDDLNDENTGVIPGILAGVWIGK